MQTSDNHIFKVLVIVWVLKFRVSVLVVRISAFIVQFSGLVIVEETKFCKVVIFDRQYSYRIYRNRYVIFANF